MDQNKYFVIAPATPTDSPNNHNVRSDVLDVTIMRIIANIQFKVENLNKLSSDHNPIHFLNYLKQER